MTRFDATSLTDDQLVTLESTLRVQLHVAKYTQVAQVTASVGSAMLTGGLSAVPSGVSIVYSHVQRRRCRQRHTICMGELAARELTPAPMDETKYAKRAYAIAMGTGLVCCILPFATDLLIDQAVLHVVSSFFTAAVDHHAVNQLEEFVETAATSSNQTTPAVATTGKLTKSSSSWTALRSTWHGTKEKLRLGSSKQRAQSLPIEPMHRFGLYEQQFVVAATECLSTSSTADEPQTGEVHVRRISNLFSFFGECYVFRFGKQANGDEDDTEARRREDECFIGLDAAMEEHLRAEEHPQVRRRVGSTCFISEDDFPIEYWTTLWIDDDRQDSTGIDDIEKDDESAVVVTTCDDGIDAFNLFGSFLEHEALSHRDHDDDAEYQLFGVPHPSSSAA